MGESRKRGSLSYISDCVIIPDPDQEGPLFEDVANTGLMVVRLGGYAIVPRATWDGLWEKVAHLEEEIDRLRCEAREER